LPELAFRLPDRGDNAGISNYVKLRSAVTCGCPRLMLNVQLAARLPGYAPGSCIGMHPVTRVGVPVVLAENQRIWLTCANGPPARVRATKCKVALSDCFRAG
jgi:hypothetical protein